MIFNKINLFRLFTNCYLEIKLKFKNFINLDKKIKN
jgi:hypothetical protein